MALSIAHAFSLEAVNTRTWKRQSGKVTKVIDDNEVQVEIAENVKIRVVRHTISQVLTKSEPAG